MAIKAIIFDCFGVLVEDSINAFYDKYVPDNPALVEELRALDHLSTEGKITFDELLDKIAEKTNVSRKEVQEFLEINPSNSRLFEYIEKELKPRYKIGFLSNAADNWLDELFSKQQQDLFDDFVLSFEHGIRKPDPKIFQLTAERLEVAPEECVMIDDVAEYCQGAKAVGMRAVQYQSVEQVVSELRAM